jgi:hypothetical protein
MINFRPLLLPFLTTIHTKYYDRPTTEKILDQHRIPYDHNHPPLYQLHRLCDENHVICFDEVRTQNNLPDKVINVINILLNKFMSVVLPSRATNPYVIEDYLMQNVHTNYLYDLLIAGRKALLTIDNNDCPIVYKDYDKGVTTTYVNAVFKQLAKDLIDICQNYSKYSKQSNIENINDKQILALFEQDKEIYSIFTGQTYIQDTIFTEGKKKTAERLLKDVCELNSTLHPIETPQIPTPISTPISTPKVSRKSRKSSKVSRKSSKVSRKSRKSTKVSRKSRKSAKVSRKSRKSTKVSRKTTKVSRKTTKVSRKSTKVSRKSKKV